MTTSTVSYYKAGLTALVLLAFSPLALHATDFVYSYTGNNFTYADSPYTTGDFIAGTLTLSSPLANNDSSTAVTPLSFSFSDGVQTLTDSSPDLGSTEFLFTTNASGTITGWHIDIQASEAVQEIGIVNQGTAIDDAASTFSAGNGGNYNSPGTWTAPAAVSVPEPSTTTLLMAAIAAAIVLRRGFRFLGIA